MAEDGDISQVIAERPGTQGSGFNGSRQTAGPGTGLAVPETADVPTTRKLGPLHTEHGDTMIADQVVQKISALATREVAGVHSMGSGNAARRAISSLAERMPGKQLAGSGGVTVAKGERQTAIEVEVVVEYGVSIVEVSQAIRRTVIAAVEHGTGLEVTEVNVHVTDIHLPDEERPQEAPQVVLE